MVSSFSLVPSLQLSVPLHRATIKDFIIDDVVIHGGEEGISPEIIFQVLKNPHHPAAKRLLSERPDNLEEIREIGKQIIPKGNIDIYAPPGDLTAMLEKYAECATDEEIAKQEESQPKDLGIPKYQDLKAIADREKLIDYTSTQPVYQYTHMLMDTIIKVAQITQNEECFSQVMYHGYIQASEQYASEILGGPLPGETPKQTANRAQVGWLNAMSYIEDEIMIIDSTYSLICDSQTTVLSVTPVFGLDRRLSERFGYNYTKVSDKYIECLVKSDDKPRVMSINVIRQPRGEYSIINTSMLMQAQALPSTTDTADEGRSIPPAKTLEKPVAVSQEAATTATTANATDDIPPLIVPLEEPAEKPVAGVPSSFDFSKLPGIPHFKIFIPTQGMPASMLPVDAMVNDTDQQLTMQSIGIISKEIVNAAGKEALLKEVKDLETTKHPRYGNGKCHPGTAVITGSGDLKHKNGKTRMLVHTVTMKKSMRDEGFTKTTFNAVLQRNYDNVLQAALDHNAHTDNENYKIHTLLMHPLGDHEIEMYKVRTSSLYFTVSMVKYIHKLQAADITVVFCCPDTKAAKISQYMVEQYMYRKYPVT